MQAISLPDWDYGSSCYLFTECLQEIAAFSAANPTHFPIVVFIHHGGTTTPQSYLGSEYSAALALLQVCLMQIASDVPALDSGTCNWEPLRHLHRELGLFELLLSYTQCPPP